jgi:hypothetical protein
VNAIHDPRPGDTYTLDGFTSRVVRVTQATVVIENTTADGSAPAPPVHRTYFERTRQAWNLTVRAAPTQAAETTSARRTTR